MVNLLELFNSKRKYYEAERVYGQSIYNFIKETNEKTTGKELPKSCGIHINFEEIGEYDSPELQITGDSRLLNSTIIEAIEKEYQLKAVYKSIQTGVNIAEMTNHPLIRSECKVYFKHKYNDNEKYHTGEDKINNITINYGAIKE